MLTALLISGLFLSLLSCAALLFLILSKRQYRYFNCYLKELFALSYKFCFIIAIVITVFAIISVYTGLHTIFSYLPMAFAWYGMTLSYFAEKRMK